MNNVWVIIFLLGHLYLTQAYTTLTTICCIFHMNYCLTVVMNGIRSYLVAINLCPANALIHFLLYVYLNVRHPSQSDPRS